VCADDFGYYRCVSAGIAHAHLHGVVTATAVLANLETLDRDLDLLRACPRLDVGVHLNLTFGRPLSTKLKRAMTANGGVFPSKIGLVKQLLCGDITAAEIEIEWRNQIEACLGAGLSPCFLNSHEHVHMLPQLFPVAEKLGASFGMRQIRVSTPDRLDLRRPVTLIRDLPLIALAARVRRGKTAPPAGFLGMSASGRLNRDFVERFVPTLEHGRVYELMCHPGFLDSAEVTDAALRRYHDWAGEVETLTHPSLPELFARHGVRVVSYRDLDEVTMS